MIEIAQNKIIIDGKQITNPELIGYHLMDFAEKLTKNEVIKITKNVVRKRTSRARNADKNERN
jgi:hypothetical protein